jgi:uncharacterized protein YndB with AHSA1/START domain
MVVQAMEPIRRSIVVPVPPDRAFAAFTDGVTDWWPSHHHFGNADIEQVVIEGREGGRWYTRHVDGSESSTGYVEAWEPPSRLVLVWQIGADWKFDPEFVSHIEVRFVRDGRKKTRVELEHRDFEEYGERAEAIRARLDDAGAWTRTLAAFAGSFA